MSSPYKATFVRSHVNGGSVLDMCLCDSLVYNLLFDAFVDKQVELVTGALCVGHWLICCELILNNPLQYSDVRHDLTRVNWD